MVLPRDVEPVTVTEDWEPQGEMPSGAWFQYRRLVGGTRILLREASPWRLVLDRDAVRASRDRLVEAVAGWEGVDTGPHRFGGTEFRVAGREVGHVHDWGLLDVPLVRPLRDAVVEAGDASAHHVLPDSGWVTTVVETDDDVTRGRALLRLSYCWHAAVHAPTDVGPDPVAASTDVRALPLDDDVAAAFERELSSQ